MRTLRKTMALVLAIAMVLTTFGAVTVSANTYADTNGHWAEGVIDTWSSNGVIQGDGGYFRPDDAITRAEVAQITQNVIGYVTSAPNSFIDVADNAWYTDAVLKLVAADVLTGNGDGTMTPDANMTREEAMTMLSRAYGLAPVNNMAGITNYADYSSISEYAQGYIGAMTAAGYVGGYPDGTIRPKDNIARGEFVKILDNMIKLYITGPGTYGPGYFGGIVMVKSGGVTLNGVIADKAVVSPLVSGDVITNNAQLTNGVLNLSDSATVNSEQGNGTSLSGVIANNYYGGSYGGGSGGSGSTVRNYTIRFYVDGELYATKTAAYNSYLSASLPIDPTAANQVFVGWYESQADANAADTLEPIDPKKTRVTGTADYYAGFTATSAVPTQAPTVSIKDPSEEYNASAPTEVKAELVTKDGKDVTVNSVVWEGTESAAQSVTLTKDKDYTIEGNTVKFTDEFLSSLYNGTHNVQIMTSAGAVSFDIVVNGSSVAAPTAAPATEAPATEAPATEAPATQAPVTTQAPAKPTQAPATQAPAKLYNATLKVNGGEGTLAAAAPAEPTQAPAEPTKAPDNPPAVGGETKVWDFSSAAWAEFAGEGKEVASEQTVDGITICGSAGKKITTNTNEKVNEGKTTYLNLGGSGNWYFKYKAETDGKIAFTIHSSGESTDKNGTLRNVLIKVGSAEAVPETYCTTEGGLSKDYTYDLKAGETIQVGGKGSTNGFWLTALSFTSGGGSVEPGTPTAAPAEPTQAPATDATAAPAPEGSSTYTVDKDTLISEGKKLTDDANVTVVSKFTCEVGENKDPQTLTIGGKEFDSTSFLRVRSQNSKPKSVSDLTFFASTGATNPDGTPSSFDCTILEITPHVDGVFKIYYRRQPESGTTDFTPDGGKDTKLADDTTGTVPCADENIETMSEGKDYGYGTKTWNLSKDKLYGLWAGGTTGTIYGYEFIPAALASDATAEAAELTPVEDAAGLYKYIREQYIDDNLDISFGIPQDNPEISYNTTFGSKNITVYSKGEGTNPKLGAAKNYDGGRIILRKGTMAEWDIDLNNVIAVCAPYDCKIKLRAGQSSGTEGTDTTLTINAQTGLGVDNPTKKELSYTLNVRNGDVEVPDTYSAKEGDIVYFWFDSGAGTVISFTFLKDDGSGTEPSQPTQAPAEPTQAPAEPTAAPAEPTQAPAEPTQAPAEPTQAPATAEPGTTVYQFEAGATVTYSGTPAAAGAVPEIKVTGADGKDIPVSGNSFTMPAQDVRVEVTYAAADTYTVSVADGITGGSVVLIPEAAAEPTQAPAEPTAAPAEPTNTPAAQEPEGGNNYPEGSIVWDFGKEPFVNADGTVNTTMFPEGDHKNDAGEIDRFNVGPESIVDVNGLTYYSVSDLGTKPSLNANQPSNRTFSDGASFTRMIKSQGKGSITLNEETGEYVKDKCFEFKAPFDGTITLYARSGGSDADANINFAINGSDVAKYTVIKTKEEDASNLPVFTKTGVFTGDTVQIYSDNNTSYYAIVFSPASAAAAEVPAEGVKSISGLKGGETIKVYAEAANAGDEIKLTTDPSAEIKDIGGGYYEFTMPAADTTVNAAFGGGSVEPGPGGIPADKLWKLNDKAVQDALAAYKTDDTAPVENVDGAVVGPGYSYDKSRSVEYVHADGTKYNFTGSLRGGSGNTEKLYVSIIPEPCACTVTVVFDGHGSAGRTQNIAYDADGDGTPEVVSSKASETGATAVTFDMTKAQAESRKPVYTYGGGSNKNLYAIFIEYYEETPEKFLSGTVTNKTGRDFSNKNIVFTNDDDPSETYIVPFEDDYMVKLPKGKTFTATVEGESDVCTTIEGQHIAIEQNRYNQEMDLTFVLIADAEVSGKVSTISSHDLLTPVYDYDAAIGAKLTFTKQGAAEPYATAEVAADGTYKATLMSNETYDIALTTADGQSYTLSPLSGSYQFLAGDQAPFKNILLMKDGPAKLDYKDTLTVGSDKEYKSISEALAAVRLMSREPGQVVNIVIDPGTYEEQLYVNMDDIALKAANPDARPLITWYYGIGYVYDSSAPQTDAGDPETGEGKSYQGWYSADYAVAKTSQWTVNNWGSTIRTLNNNFYMENIDAQSSFNLYITPKELSDHVTPGGGDAKVGVLRDSTETKVNNKTYNERAAAIFAGGSQIELYKCSFVSSQDTFGTGASSMYVKDCLISGNTDYICGGNNCYFENCELRWQGMSDTDNGGYITACKNSAETDLGYYFKNCTITRNPDTTMKAGAGGAWGRPWGGKGKTVTIYDNTTIGEGVNKPTKWDSMSGSKPSDAIYYVVNGVYKAGDPATDITNNSQDNPNGTYDANGYTLPTPEQYFGDWAPANYTAAQ